MIQQAKFIYSHLEKAPEIETNKIEDQYKNQVKALEKHGKQLIKSSGEKDSNVAVKRILWNFKNKKKFLMSFLMKGGLK